MLGVGTLIHTNPISDPIRGMRFAKVQSRVCVAKFLSKFRVEPSKNTPTVLEYDPMRIVLIPKGGIHLNILRR
ncbi:Cytochrome P450 6B1 [Papilio machaon]|uniref:Cytochrome P450 6B1 n=1 Tax=Papilio machaon TaxID=76193 RepID=A0A0N1IQF5_PAPMA|nr:Cytochrome P450 6B1 [Papilio machaon]